MIKTTSHHLSYMLIETQPTDSFLTLLCKYADRGPSVEVRLEPELEGPKITTSVLFSLSSRKFLAIQHLMSAKQFGRLALDRVSTDEAGR